MSSLNQDDDLEVDLPKMKTISKPKNLKKRRRDTPEEEDPADESKKAKIEGEDDESEYVRNSEAQCAVEVENWRLSCKALRHAKFAPFRPSFDLSFSSYST